MLLSRGIDVFPKPVADGCANDCIQRIDLAAQQSMAGAGWVMAGIAAIGVIVSAVTLIFLWRTVIYAKDTAAAAAAANLLARNAFVSDQRAWVTITNVHFGTDLTWSNEEGRATVNFRMNNIGRTPAVGVGAEVKFIFDFSIEQPPFGPPPSQKAARLGFTMFPDQPIDYGMNIPINLAEARQAYEDRGIPMGDHPLVIFPKVLIRITYFSPIDEPLRHTSMMLNIRARPDASGNIAFGPSFGTVARERLIIERGVFDETIAD